MNMDLTLKDLLSDSKALNEFQQQIFKAAETNATYAVANANRSIFAPENLDAEIKLLVPTGTPMRNKIPRVPGMGQAAAWDKLTSALHSKYSPSAGAGTNTSIAFADAAAPGETSQTYARVAAAYKLLGRKVEVGGMALAASKGRGPEDMLQQREKVKMFEMMLGEEQLLIQGDSAYDTNEFDGLLKQITTNSGTASLLTASGIGVYCQSLADTYGAYPTDLVASGRQIRALADDLQGSGSIQRVVVDAQGNAVGGVALRSIINPIAGDSVIAVSHNRYMGTNALLLTLRSPAGENYIEIEDLIPASRVDVPSSTFSVVRFVVEAMVLKVMAETFQYKIQGLAV